MNILLIAPQPFFVERGTPIAVRLLATTLADLGHAVDLVVFSEGEDVKMAGVRVLRTARIPGVTDIPVGFSMKKILSDIALGAKLLFMSFRRKYDVYHAVEESVFLALMLRPIHRARVVYDMDSSLSDQMSSRRDGDGPMSRFYRSMERQAISRSDAVAAVCRSLADLAGAYRDESSVFLLPDVPLIEKSDQSTVDNLREFVAGDHLISLYVGNLEKYQGIDLIVQAMAKILGRGETTLVVIGGHPQDIEKYRQMCDESGLADAVKFIGPRPLKDLGAYLEQADILVSPRISGTNTPMKLYSYMASGRAILATRLTTHTQVMDASMAKLCDPDPDSFGSGWISLIEDPDYRNKLGIAAAKEIDINYTADAFRTRVERLYEHVQRKRVPEHGKPT